MALQTKLNIDNAPVQDVGGLQFDPAGKAVNPAAPGEPCLWVGNGGGPGFPIYYTDDLGNTYDLRIAASAGFIGFTYTCPPGTLVGEMVYISAPNTVALADAVVGNAARGMVINIYGGGTTCDIAYGAEIVNGAWALVPNTTYYLDTAGAFAAAPPMGWVVQQEIGFARNPTTMVFRPTIITR